MKYNMYSVMIQRHKIVRKYIHCSYIYLTLHMSYLICKIHVISYIMTFHINYAKKVHCSCLKAQILVPPHQHPRHLGYQFNTDDLATTAGSTKTNGTHLGTTPHEEVIYPPGKLGGDHHRLQKTMGFFFGGGRYVSFGGG